MSRRPGAPLPSPGERRRLREAGGLTPEQVADRVGVTRETVRSWEAGRTAPRGRKREAYAALLAGLDARAERAAGTDPAALPNPTEPVARPADPAAPVASAAAPGPAPAPPPTASPPSPVPPGSSEVPAGAARVPPRDRQRPPAHPPDRRDRHSRKPPQHSTTPPRTVPVRHGHAAPGGPSSVNAIAHPLSVPFGRRHAVDGSVLLADRTPGLTPAQAFDRLYGHSAPALVRQTYLLTGRRALAQESVERAFHQAWQRWPEVAVDRDPAGWVRAAAYEYAVSPWHRFRRAHRQPEPPPAHPEDHALLDALLALPPSYRRTLLLYDGVGLDLPETAAETEASTPAAAGRLTRARRSVAERLPAFAEPEALRRGLERLARGEKLQPPRTDTIRAECERRARFWTRTAIAFTVLILGATALTLRTAPTAYEPPEAPPETVRGVPPRMGPGPLTEDRRALRDQLREAPGHGPHRVHPQLR
ncbi:sigma factor-like helix-turn-helix DNA-binding protein [Streptomyces sp. NPDC049906]|uniref:sigma factor-like helix-turn-helix DNA-binding protein n=1 Tax=Streptomyces sp. NPDC049906 TaxID=3155656 RepID=UPI0034320D8D